MTNFDLAMAIANAAERALEFQERHRGMKAVENTFGEQLPDGCGNLRGRTPDENSFLLEGYIAIRKQVEAIGEELFASGNALKEALKEAGLARRLKEIHQPFDVIELLQKLPKVLSRAA